MSPTVKKALRYSILSVILIVGLLVATIFFIRHRTIGQWDDFKTHWEAQGEHFDIEHFIPDPIPDEENLAMHQLFLGFEIEDSPAQEWFDQVDPVHAAGYEKRTTSASTDFCRHANFADWKDLPENLTQEDRIAEIQRRVEFLNDPLDQIAEALASRPQCQYPFDWDNPLTASTPQVFQSLGLAHAYLIRTHLALHSGQNAVALEDFITLQRLASSVGRTPTWAAFLVELAISKASLGIVWEGLALNQFDEHQLLQLDAQLADIASYPEALLPVFRFERAGLLHLIDSVETKAEAKKAARGSNLSPLARFWLASNRLAASQDLQEQLLAPHGTLVTRPTLADAIKADESLKNRGKGLGKITAGLGLMLPSTSNSLARALEYEADITNARIAIAIERHRLKHGSYPAALSDLVPAFLPTLPIDQINHRPIEYRIKSDGTPLIYQWGCDGDDDGGAPRRNPLHGDIVWQYTLDTPLTNEEHERED